MPCAGKRPWCATRLLGGRTFASLRASCVRLSTSHCLSVSAFRHGLLLGDQVLHALFGERDHLRQLLVVEDLVFGGGLDFDHFVAGGHDEVHVDVGARVFFVGEVEQDFSVDNSHADGGDEILERDCGQRSGIDQLFQSEAERDECAGDRRGARAAVGLDDVAVDPDGALAEARRDR